MKSCARYPYSWVPDCWVQYLVPFYRMPVFDEHFYMICRVYNMVSATLFYFIQFITIINVWGIVLCYFFNELNGNEQMEINTTVLGLCIVQGIIECNCMRWKNHFSHLFKGTWKPDHYGGRVFGSKVSLGCTALVQCLLFEKKIP